MRSFHEIGVSVGTQKVTIQRFDLPYEKHFSHRRNDPLSILEIGVYEGASIKLWEEYFPLAKISAIDIVPSCAKFSTPRTQVYTGDQADENLLACIVKERAPFDLVVDDGGHEPLRVWETLRLLWPYLKPEGWYVIEDVDHMLFTHEVLCRGAISDGEFRPIRMIMDRFFRAVNVSDATFLDLRGLSEIHLYKAIIFLRKA